MENLRRHVVHHRPNRMMQSNPPQGGSGQRRGAHSRRRCPGGRGCPNVRAAPKGRPAHRAPHSVHKAPPQRKPIAESGPSPLAPRSPHRSPQLKKCYASKVKWEECIEMGMIPKGTIFKTHHEKFNAEGHVEQRGNDYEGTEIDPPIHRAPPRRQNVKRGPSYGQSKSLYISRALRYL